MLLCKIQRSDPFFLLIMQTELYSLSRLAPGRSLISSVLWSLLPCHFPFFLLPRHSSKMATGSHPFQVSVQTPLTREDALPILEDALPVPAGWKSAFCSSCYTQSPLNLWHKAYISCLSSPPKHWLCELLHAHSFVPWLLPYRTTWEAITDEWMVFFINELKSLSRLYLSVTQNAICMFEYVKECWEENGAVSTELWLVRISLGGGEAGETEET